jgi:hypothetical protein
MFIYVYICLYNRIFLMIKSLFLHVYMCIYVYYVYIHIYLCSYDIYVCTEEVPELLSRYYTLRDATEELLALNNEQENETEEFRVKLQALKTEMQNKSLVGKICIYLCIYRYSNIYVYTYIETCMYINTFLLIYIYLVTHYV